MREPLDTNLHMPRPLKQEAAAQRLLELLPAELADQVWDELIAPLYDSRQMRIHWDIGHCRHCRVEHPGWWAQNRPGQAWRGHKVYCRLYVGPLEHHHANGHMAFAGWRRSCSCGQSWLEQQDGKFRESCPDADVDWRGPRPGEGETGE